MKVRQINRQRKNNHSILRGFSFEFSSIFSLQSTHNNLLVSLDKLSVPATPQMVLASAECCLRPAQNSTAERFVMIMLVTLTVAMTMTMTMTMMITITITITMTGTTTIAMTTTMTMSMMIAVVTTMTITTPIKMTFF